MNKKITNQQLEKKLRSLPIGPSKIWQEKALLAFEEKIQNDVSEENNNRIYSIFYLLKNTYMMAKTKLIAIAAGALGLIALSGATAYAADQSVPGDPLYGLDKAMESISRKLKFSDDAKAEYELNIMQERVQEMKKLHDNGEDPEKLQLAVQEMLQQQEQAKERVRTMEENTENRNDNAELERTINRYEEQNDEAEKLKKQVQNKQNGSSTDESSTLLESTSSQEGNQIHQQDRDQDQGMNGDQTGDGDQPMNQNGNGY